MKIVIAGAGAVGSHLAELLSAEKHDITVLDERADRLNYLNQSCDLLTLQMPPMNISSLREADVNKADLFIAVMNDEARNLTSCMLASKLGAKKTVARVDNYEYTQPDNREFFKGIGVSSIIYPEMLAGKEIAANIQRSWVRQWIEVQDGKLLLIGVKVRDAARLLNVPLMKLSAPDSPFHVVAIKRRGETLIPHGNDCIKSKDVVYFMTTPKYVSYIKELVGKEDYPDVKNVVFLGGGGVVEQTLQYLPDYMHAKVFERDKERIEQISGNVDDRNVLFINGDGTDLDLLIDEGLSTAQAFVAASGNSETNILSCLTAKRNGVRKTVAMVENSDLISMAESLDIGSILNKKTLAAGHIYQMMLKADITTVKKLTIAAADVAEIIVQAGSRAAKHAVKDLGLPSTMTLGGMVRGGKGYLINGSTQLEVGDVVVAFCIEGSLRQLEKFFK